MISYEALVTRKKSVAVVGLGYVGLPLAVELAKHFDVIGFDIKKERVAQLRSGHDNTNEVSDKELAETKALLTSDPQSLNKAGVIIVAVPTPIDEHRNPDLRPRVWPRRP